MPALLIFKNILKTFVLFLLFSQTVGAMVPSRVPARLRAAFQERVMESRQYMRDFMASPSMRNAQLGDEFAGRTPPLYRQNLASAYNHIAEIAPPWIIPPAGKVFSPADFEIQAYLMGADPQMWRAYRFDKRMPSAIMKSGFQPPPTGHGDIFSHSFYLDSSNGFADTLTTNPGNIVSASAEPFNMAAMNLVATAGRPIFLYQFDAVGVKVPDVLEFGEDEVEIMFRSVAKNRITHVTAVIMKRNDKYIRGATVPIADAVRNPSLMSQRP